MTRTTLRSQIIACLIALPLLLVTAGTNAKPDDDDAPDLPDTQSQMELMGFTEDGLHFAIKITDEEGRGGFQLRESKTGKIVKRKSWMSETIQKDLKKKWRGMKRRFKIKFPPANTTENTKKGLMLVSAQKGDKLVIYIVKGDKIKPYSEIQLQKGRKGKPAKATVKALNWDPNGKFIIVVYSQKVPKRQVWEGDFVKTLRFLAYKAKF